VQALADFRPAPDAVIIDALFGAGLSKPLQGEALTAVERIAKAGAPVVAVDLPSGLSGESGQVLGAACRAELTVTFFRPKPGHLLMPGRGLCGELVVADIGIPDRVLEKIGPKTFRNGAELWRALLPRPEPDTHKYRRGHVGVAQQTPCKAITCRLVVLEERRRRRNRLDNVDEHAIGIGSDEVTLAEVLDTDLANWDRVGAYTDVH
jgi:ADP-dependent NAD(P)H-hydrate dehydratase / NAD(P)H-hydrate epimerase